MGLTGGLNNDLGLADVVADGLITLDATKSLNVYGVGGPAPLSHEGSLTGARGTFIVTTPDHKTISEDAILNGSIVYVPPPPGTFTPGTISINGTVTLSNGGHSQTYYSSLSGNAFLHKNPIEIPGLEDQFQFTATGNLVAQNKDISGGPIRDVIGLNPSISLGGTIDKDFATKSLILFGSSTQAGALTGTTVEVDFPSPGNKALFAGAVGGGGSKTNAGTASAAGSTSFGSLIDFIIVAGVNGGPYWNYLHIKNAGGGGSGGAGNAPGGQFVGINRTRTDSLSITFVPGCQEQLPDKIDPDSYWDTIGVCDEAGSAAQQSAIIGSQNNTVMVLRQFLLKQGGAVAAAQ
jgi:hypothetical protein